MKNLINNKQLWIVLGIVLIGAVLAGFILKTEKPTMAELGMDEHAEHADSAETMGAITPPNVQAKMPPKHGEAGHNHEKDHNMPMPAQAGVQTQGDDGHNHAAMASESNKGPHGGKLFTDGEYAVEVTIFKQNQPPQFRLYSYLNGKQLAAKDSTIGLKLSRLGRSAETFAFVPENDYLSSKITVAEPHSFKVDIDAVYGGKTHEFTYNQVEARVTLSNEQLKHNAIEVLTAAPANIQTTLRMLGEIKHNADKTVQVLPRVGGVVESVSANAGDTVKRGQTLAVISSPMVAENRGDLQAALQRLALAKTTLVREETLWREKISAEQDYIAAKNDMRMAEIEVMRNQQKLSSRGIAEGNGTRYTLTAPSNGVITSKNIAVGQVIDITNIVFEVADLSTVWAEMSIPTKDLSLVKTGQKVTVRSSAFAQNTTGTITYIAPLVNAQTRTATARVVLPNSRQNWLAGLPVNIDLVADEVSVPLAVSLEAIQSLPYGDVVFGRYGEYFEARPVKLGKRDDKNVEVLSGLNVGEQYAAGNSFVVKAELGKAGASHDH